MTNHYESKQKRTRQQHASRRLPSEIASLPASNETSADRIKRLLTRAEVARILQVCPHSIQRLTRRGILPAIVFNRRLIRYDAAVIERYIRSAVVGK
jgi:hypothetical protein